MRAIIMAGGFGTRLRPLTINVPKPMTPVGNVPMMEHVVGLLKKHNITDITSLLYFMPEKIRDYFGDGSEFGVQMSYAQPTEDLGTAGAVRYALGDSEEPVLVISGDLVTNFDLTAAMKWHEQKKSDASILLRRMENPLAYGIVITDQDGRIVRFLEKPSWGEAFSDTINTGIYILEPSAFKLIPNGENFDFSQNLFPLMLEKKMGLYGEIMDGYWKDVGNVDEYHRVHLDIFDGSLKLNLRGTCQEIDGAELWQGDNVTIGKDVTISGRVVLGNDVVIDSGAKLDNCVIGDRTRIGSACEISNSIIWSDSGIGDKGRMSRAIVCRKAQFGRNVQLMDNVIISDECNMGESATVKANCKIWPGKTVEKGATVSTSMVWGEKWNRELFTNSKIMGLAMTELTPEMAVKIGSSLGAFLGVGNSVVVSRDASDGSRLLKRALISGLLAAGVNVSDLETLPVPIVRFCLSREDFGAGIYLRHNPDDHRMLDLIFFDGNGVDMPISKLKKIERMYFGEDFERAGLDDIGHLETPQRVLEDYRSEFSNNIDSQVIRDAGFKIVIDHSNGSSSQVFPTLFYNLGISATELNGNLNPRKFTVSPEDNAQAVVQLSSIVSSLKADVGFLLNPAAEKLTVIDGDGQPIDPQVLLLIVTDLFLRTHKIDRLAVPVGASMGVEEIASRHNVEVIRIPNTHLSMIDTFRLGKADYVGGTRGGFIFPGFQLGADAILSAVKILEMLAKTRMSLAEMKEEYDHYSRQSVVVPCPWSKKGTVMRRLITETEEKERQLIDGVRILEENGWVLITPDLLTAAFNITVESSSKENANSLLSSYQSKVQEYQS